MLVVRAAKNWFLLIAQHWKATLPCFLGGALLFIAVAAWWPKAYTGTALMEPNPSVNWQPDIASQKATENEAILRATTPSAWLAIAERLHPSPEAVAAGGYFDAAHALATRVSIQQVDDAKHGDPLLRISYTAPSRDRALAVTAAVAEQLANPGLENPGLVSPSMAPSPSPGPGSARTSLSDSPMEEAAPVHPGPYQQADTKASPAAETSADHRTTTDEHLPRNRTPSVELARQLQARVDEGAKLEVALNENASTLASLQQQLTQIDQKAAVAPIAKTAPPQPQRKAPTVNPQIENLRQEVAHNQQTLADLQKRYTEDYPDVVAAKEKVRDLQIDIARLEAIDARSAQGQPPPQQPAPPSVIRDDSARNQVSQRLNQAQAVQDQLRQALDRNHSQQARLRSEVASPPASSKAIDSPPATAVQQAATSPTSQNTGQTTLPAVSPAAALAAPSAASRSSGPSTLKTTGSPSGAPASAATSPSTAAPAAPQSDSTLTPRNAEQPAALSLAESPTLAVSPVYFAAPLSWLLSLVLGSFAAFAAAWLLERRDPSIRSERMLRQVLPNSAAILGGIPRVRHEVIPE